MEIVCIVCPNGCTLTVSSEGDIISVSGNKCARGKAFAIEEMTAPKRSVCTSVATVFRELPVVSVRTDGDIPKDKMKELVAYLNKQRITRIMSVGEVLCRDVLGTGVDVIITTDMKYVLDGSSTADFGGDTK